MRPMGDLKISEQLIVQLVQSSVIVVGALVLLVIIRRGLELGINKAGLPALALKPVSVICRVVILLSAALMIATLFGYNANSILGGLMAVAGLVAIGFVALWSVLSNTLCTFVLIIFKPFSVGDELHIPSDDVTGKVVDVSLMFTTLREESGALIQIPNNMFFQKVFKRHPGKKVVELEDQLAKSKPTE